MAEGGQLDLGSLVVALEAETSGLAKARQAFDGLTQRVEAAVSKIESSMKKMESSFQGAATQTRALGASTKTLADDSRRVEAAMAKQGVAAERAKSQFRLLRSEALAYNASAGVTAEQQLVVSATINQSTQALATYASSMRRGARSSTEMQMANLKLKEAFSRTRLAMRNLTREQDAAKFKGFTSAMRDLSQSASIALGPLSGVASRITIFTNLLTRNTAALAIFITSLIGFAFFTAKALKTASSLQTQLMKLGAQIRSTGRDAEFTVGQLDEMARALGRDTLTNAEQARDALSRLLTFEGIGGKNIERVLELSQDLTAVMGGELANNARKLGKALEDPASGLEALRQSGVVFTEQQRTILRAMQEMGQKAEVVEYILKKLENAVGGAGKAEAEGLAGAYDTLKERLTDFLETAAAVGALDPLTKALKFASDKITEFTNDADKMRAIQIGVARATAAFAWMLAFAARHVGKFGLIIAGLAAASGIASVTAVVKGLSGAFGKLGVAAIAAGGVLIGPFGMGLIIVGATAAGVVVAIGKLIDTIRGIKDYASPAIVEIGRLKKEFADLGIQAKKYESDLRDAIAGGLAAQVDVAERELALIRKQQAEKQRAIDEQAARLKADLEAPSSDVGLGFVSGMVEGAKKGIGEFLAVIETAMKSLPGADMFFGAGGESNFAAQWLEQLQKYLDGVDKALEANSEVKDLMSGRYTQEGWSASVVAISEVGKALDDVAVRAKAGQSAADGLFKSTRTEIESLIFQISIAVGHLENMEEQLRRAKEPIPGLTEDIKKMRSTVSRLEYSLVHTTLGLDEFSSSFDKAIPPIERYENQVHRLNAGLVQGHMSQRQFDQALKDVRISYLEAEYSAEQLAGIIASGFAEGIIAGDSFKETINDIANSIARLMLQMLILRGIMWTMSPTSTATGDITQEGFAFPGRKASGGPVSSGRQYLVGEQGPELFVPGQAGNIVPNSMGGGDTFQLYIDATGAAPGTAAEIRRMLGDVEKRAVMSTLRVISDNRRRGGA